MTTYPTTTGSDHGTSEAVHRRAVLMLSERSYELIGQLLQVAMHQAEDAQEEGRREEYSQARYEFITMIDREVAPAENADQALVDGAIRRHAVDMLKLTVHRPQAREIFPADPFAQAQWHLLRITALRAAPLDLAAAQLREEAMTALTPPEAKA